MHTTTTTTTRVLSTHMHMHTTLSISSSMHRVRLVEYAHELVAMHNVYELVQ